MLLIINGKNDADRQHRKKQTQAWVDALKPALKQEEFAVWPHVKNPEDVTFACVWNHPPGVFKNFPHLKAVSSLGAGVNHIFNDDSLPSNIPVARIKDPILSRDMSHYVIQSVLHITRRVDYFHEAQQQKTWQQKPPYTLNDRVTVGIMGLGEIGQRIAEDCQHLGVPVIGWRRSQKNITGITCYDEKHLNDFLKQTHCLVCMLPLTPATENIINHTLLSQLPKGAYVINIARGQHVVDADLIAAIDSGHISGAKLDVFHTEPLPKDHPFWTHPKITLTPHNAGVSKAANCADQLLENYRRIKADEPLLNLADQNRGY